MVIEFKMVSERVQKTVILNVVYHELTSLPQHFMAEDKKLKKNERLKDESNETENRMKNKRKTK